MSLLAVLFAIAMLVWSVPIVRSGRPFPLALIVLVSGTIFGPHFFAINGPIQISLDRVLFAVMIVVAAAGLRMRTTQLPSLTRGDALVVAMVIWFFVSAVTADGPPPKTPPLARWLFYVAMPAGMYAVARMISIRQRDVRWLSWGAIGLGVYLAVTAVFEIRGLHALVFPRYIVDPQAWEFFGRGRGPLMNPSGNAIVMSIAAACAAMGFVGAPRHRKLVLGVATLCLMTGIYATLTRSAWLGGLSAVAIVISVHSPRWVRALGLATAVFLVAIAATGLKDEILQIKRDKNLSAADAAKSVQLRPLLAVVAWEMFQDKPLTGHGYGRYLVEHERFLQDRSYGLPLEQTRPYMQHNVFLSVLVDTGLIGFSLFVGWCVYVVAAGWKLARGGASRLEVRSVGMLMVGTFFAYLCNGMFQDVMIIPMVHMFLFFLGGLTVTTMQAGIEAQAVKASRAADALMPWGGSSVGTPPPWGSVPTRADFGVELRSEDG
jgi:O-antigen ligase